MSYLESDMSRLGVCSWHRGVKGSIWPPGLAEHHHLILDGDLEEKHVGSHSGRYPKVDGPMETEFQEAKMVLTFSREMVRAREEASPTPSPVQHTKEAKPHPACSDLC